MKKFSFVVLLLLLCACSEKKITGPLTITPIQDTSVLDKKNGVQGYFVIQNFRNNKQGIKDVFDYMANVLYKQLPFNRDGTSVYLLKNKENVYFEDGYAEVRSCHFFLFFLDEKNPGCFTDMIFTPSRYSMGTDGLEEKFPKHSNYYRSERKADSLDVYMKYKKFDLDVFQKYLNVFFYHQEIKRSEIDYFRLINEKTGYTDCIIEYIDLQKRIFKVIFTK